MALVAITVSNAQVVPVAILTSGDEVTTFYGKEALRHAHQAAKEGDVINLSPGSFLWTEINKGVSIIGSGVDPNSPDGYTRILTGFEGHMRLRHPESSELRLENLYMEARVLHTGSKGKVWMKRCNVPQVYGDPWNAEYGEIQVSNCVFRDQFRANAKSIVYNSEFSGYVDIDRSEVGHYFSNCVFQGQRPSNSSCENCIFVNQGGRLHDSTSATGCKYIGSMTDFFQAQNGDNECVDATNVFKENTFYELSDEYAQKWLAKDGSQIGLYGEPEPFTLIPDNPRITKFNVASKTLADGKLSVDIEVVNPTK